MNKQKTFENIEKLYPYLRTYQQKGTVIVPRHDLLLLKEVWENDIMKTRLDIACGTCVTWALNILQSWYEREKQFEQPQPVIQPAPEKQPENLVIDKKKPCKSCKNKKDNSK